MPWLALPVQGGVGFPFVGGLSIGPVASYTPVIGLAGIAVGVGESSHMRANTYGVWGLPIVSAAAASVSSAGLPDAAPWEMNARAPSFG